MAQHILFKSRVEATARIDHGPQIDRTQGFDNGVVGVGG